MFTIFFIFLEKTYTYQHTVDSCNEVYLQVKTVIKIIVVTFCIKKRINFIPILSNYTELSKKIKRLVKNTYHKLVPQILQLFRITIRFPFFDRYLMPHFRKIRYFTLVYVIRKFIYCYSGSCCYVFGNILTT